MMMKLLQREKDQGNQVERSKILATMARKGLVDRRVLRRIMDNRGDRLHILQVLIQVRVL